MKGTIVLIASVAIVASIPAVAAESTSNKDIDASRARSATVSSRPANTADNEKACRAYAASFYESVTRRQTATYANGGRALALLDSVISAFNDLLATKCAG
ncbi:hypothetical protein BSZ19_35335 [Bradyrhizobium japonicum]|uniref:Uncharacterized protein n=1 Tax=Bradyrhizobium japonicum TaxID=375 RepID=A0A1Y2JHG7_BRAJP|nr:hypothetical protein [Bradyrhizobium japonicum]OSJ26544.1 hypothetical protein BSZ19_35335 [Bradyrhizobium japonicum]